MHNHFLNALKNSQPKTTTKDHQRTQCNLACLSTEGGEKRKALTLKASEEEQGDLWLQKLVRHCHPGGGVDDI